MEGTDKERAAIRARLHEIDVQVGGNIRTRRKALGVSQGTLAKALGLTFQQVQKYERGSNRVSASMLWGVAKVLQCTPADLYDGTPDLATTRVPAVEAARAFAASAEGIAVGSVWAKISAPVRRRLVQLVRVMAGAGEEMDVSLVAPRDHPRGGAVFPAPMAGEGPPASRHHPPAH